MIALNRRGRIFKIVNTDEPEIESTTLTTWNETGFIKKRELSETQFAELDAHN